jgi:hypothetical protein
MDDESNQVASGVNEAIERVGQLDLSRINRKLKYDNPDYWSDERIAEAEETYRRFLALHLIYPEQTLAVNHVLDEYWHAHILDTEKYVADCDAIFGRVLHHDPYFGLPGEANEGENVPAFAVTQRIWQETFGAPLVKEARVGPEPRLTLDRVLGGLDRADDGPDAAPKGCKNCEHCTVVVAPQEIDANASIIAVVQEQ